MWFENTSSKLIFFILFTIVKTKADSSACEQREKHNLALDLAKETITKVKDFHPACVNDSKDISSNSSECGGKEKVSAYLDFANKLIGEAKENFTSCATNITKVVRLHKKPADCLEILENGESKSGEYTIWPRHRIFYGSQLTVYCDMETDGGGWTVIQRRGNFSEKNDFHRNWTEYKHGFGNISEEFWLGNDNIFVLTNQGNNAVRFDMEDINREYRFATYSSFWIEDENAGYKLHFGKYNGTAGNHFEANDNKEFSTKDNISKTAGSDCPFVKKGGWWYETCGWNNPNGINLPGGTNNKMYMNWYPFTKYDSLFMIEIKIRSEN